MISTPSLLYMYVQFVSGWWYTYPSEKYELVSWDYEIPTEWKNKIHVPNHQPDIEWETGIFRYLHLG